MVIDQKFVGKEYPSISYEIGYEKIKEFLIATKGDQEKFSEIVPPTFPVVYGHELLGVVLFDKELKLNLSKLVHGEQEFIYHKPVKAGDTIITAGKIEKIFQKGPHDFVVFVTSSKNQLGDKVCDCIWTFVIRGGNDTELTLKEKLMMKMASLMPDSRKEKNLQFKALQDLIKKAQKSVDLSRAKQDLYYYEKLSETESRMLVFVDKYMPQVYAGASGDFNIIHLDQAFGRSVGLGSNILHGMATMALGANFAMHDQSPKNLKRYRVRFSAPVKPMDTLTYKGAWFGKEFKFNAVNQKGQEVLNSALIEVN